MLRATCWMTSTAPTHLIGTVVIAKYTMVLGSPPGLTLAGTCLAYVKAPRQGTGMRNKLKAETMSSESVFEGLIGLQLDQPEPTNGGEQPGISTKPPEVAVHRHEIRGEPVELGTSAVCTFLQLFHPVAPWRMGAPSISRMMSRSSITANSPRSIPTTARLYHYLHVQAPPNLSGSETDAVGQ